MDFITGLLLVALLSAALFFGVKQVRAGERSWILSQPKKQMNRKTKMFLKRQQLKEKLEKLSKTKPPTNLSMGAMCYDMCMPTGTLDVICSHCKKKSVHPNNTTISDVIESERIVQAIRRATEGLDAKLDNRAYCANCTKESNSLERQLFFEVRYADSEEVHRIAVVRAHLAVVLAFLQGKDRIENNMGAETALTQKVNLLSRVLGIELAKEERK